MPQRYCGEDSSLVASGVNLRVVCLDFPAKTENMASRYFGSLIELPLLIVVS